MWLAPNVITLIGLVINLVTMLVLSYFCWSAKEQVNSFYYCLKYKLYLLNFRLHHGHIFLLHLVYFFTKLWMPLMVNKHVEPIQHHPLVNYLIMDVIQYHKVCNRILYILILVKRSFKNRVFIYPFLVFVTLNICYAMQLGEIRYGVLIINVISIIVFYAAQWSTYCTGQLRFAKFDVTEAQMTVIGCLVVTGIFGPKIWSIHLLGLSFKYITIGGCTILCIAQILGYVKVIFCEGAGRNGSTVADTSVLSPLFPLLAVVVPFCMIYSKSTTGIYDANITLFCLCFGAVAAKAANRLVIAHMSRWELSLWDWIYLSPLAMILNQYYDFYFDEYKLLIVATVSYFFIESF